MDLIRFANGRRFGTILADPPWQFTNKTGKVAPEHRRLSRYGTMKLDEITALPVEQVAASTAHLYLWCPNALLPEGIAVLQAWGFRYKSNIVWHKVQQRRRAQTVAASVFIFATLPNSFCSACAAKMPARSRLDGDR